MFVNNGIVYGEQPDDPKEVESVKPLENRMMIITFPTGEQRLYDTSGLRGPAFEPLNDPEVFKTATVVQGAVTWMDGKIRCFSEFMYRDSYKYSNDL